MVKVGFVGCGGIAQEHYRHLSSMDDVEIVGHCDIDETRALAGVARYGGEAFTDFRAMYDKAKLDAVYVCVPPDSHVGMEEAAAERGIHLFIEKPIALDKATARRIATAIRASDSIVSVGYCFRYYDTISLARQILKGKAVSQISGEWIGSMPSIWWWRRMAASGGQFLEQTTHLVDLLRYLCGEVAEVHGIKASGCMTHIKEFDVHDSSVVCIRLKSGAVASFRSSCVANHGGRVSLEVVTPEATLTFSEGRLTVHEEGKTTDHFPRVNMYEEENKAFIEAVRSGKRGRIKSTYADALKTFQVTYAANESFQSGLPVVP